MSKNDGVPFLAKLRRAGAGGSVLLTVPREIADFLDLKAGDVVEVHLKKAQKPDS